MVDVSGPHGKPGRCQKHRKGETPACSPGSAGGLAARLAPALVFGGRPGGIAGRAPSRKFLTPGNVGTASQPRKAAGPVAGSEPPGSPESAHVANGDSAGAKGVRDLRWVRGLVRSTSPYGPFSGRGVPGPPVRRVGGGIPHGVYTAGLVVVLKSGGRAGPARPQRDRAAPALGRLRTVVPKSAFIVREAPDHRITCRLAQLPLLGA